MTPDEACAIVLAAGYSSRMGEFKPLMRLGGQTLLGRVVGLFRAAGVRNVVVVTGHRAKEVRAEACVLGVSAVHNERYEQGMFSSVVAGVRDLGSAAGFFVHPVDIPLVRADTVTALLDAFDGQTATYPCFGGQRGHPPLLPASLVPMLLAHDGQDGLQGVLRALPAREQEVWDRGILLDADSPEDFAVLVRRVDRWTLGERDEALALARLRMPDCGVAHGLAVSRVALKLAAALQKVGVTLDMDVVHNAALLHDIAKGGPEHERRGAELLQSLGLTALVESVGSHRDVPPPVSGIPTEKEVVYLADKLVRGVERVSVRQRFEEKLSKYAHDEEACRAILGRMQNGLGMLVLFERLVGHGVEDVLTEAAS